MRNGVKDEGDWIGGVGKEICRASVLVQTGSKSPKFSIFLSVDVFDVEVRQITNGSVHYELSIILVKKVGRKEGKIEKTENEERRRRRAVKSDDSISNKAP